MHYFCLIRRTAEHPGERRHPFFAKCGCGAGPTTTTVLWARELWTLCPSSSGDHTPSGEGDHDGPSFPPRRRRRRQVRPTRRAVPWPSAVDERAPLPPVAKRRRRDVTHPGPGWRNHWTIPLKHQRRHRTVADWPEGTDCTFLAGTSWESPSMK